MSGLRLATAAASLALLLTALPMAAEASPELRVEGRHFVDASGRVVILRGVNVAGNAKVPPFRPAEDPAIFDPLKAWGMNVARLLFTWEAYEPAPGAYDEGYLDYYAAAARAAWDRGLYVIVDFHQDAFSRFTIGGCGDGFPAWALPPSISPAQPDNGPACEDWGLRMIKDSDMHAAWASFYADETGARTRYLAMLKSVAARLEGEPGVIGYDIMNEPWGDEVMDLAPFHNDATAAIREASPSAIIFVSPRALTSSGEPTKLPPPAFSNAAYAPHFYDATVLLFKTWSGTQPTEAFANMTGTAEAWGVPLFLGEFGAPAETVNGDLYMNAMYRRLDEGLASGAQWVYTPGWTPEAKDGWNAEDLSIVDDLGRTRPNFRPRPYPRRISGAPVSLLVTSEQTIRENRLEIEWDHDPKTGETEIFMPSGAFFGIAGAATIEASGDGLECSVAPTGSIVQCASAVAGKKRVVLRAPSPTPAEPGGCAATRSTNGDRAISVGALALFIVMIAASRRARR